MRSALILCFVFTAASMLLADRKVPKPPMVLRGEVIIASIASHPQKLVLHVGSRELEVPVVDNLMGCHIYLLSLPAGEGADAIREGELIRFMRLVDSKDKIHRLETHEALSFKPAAVIKRDLVLLDDKITLPRPSLIAKLEDSHIDVTGNFSADEIGELGDITLKVQLLALKPTPEGKQPTPPIELQNTELRGTDLSNPFQLRKALNKERDHLLKLVLHPIKNGRKAGPSLFLDIIPEIVEEEL